MIGKPIPWYYSITLGGLFVAFIILTFMLFMKPSLVVVVLHAIVLTALLTILVLVVLNMIAKCACDSLHCGMLNECGVRCGCREQQVCIDGLCVSEMIVALGRSDLPTQSVMYSIDGGETFRRATIPSFNYDHTDPKSGLFDIDYNPTNHTFIIAGTELEGDGGAYHAITLRSTDYGLTWQKQVYHNLVSGNTITFSSSTNTWFLGGQRTSDNHTCILQADKSSAFTKEVGPPDTDNCTSLIWDSFYKYVWAVCDGAIYLTKDNGKSWDVFAPTPPSEVEQLYYSQAFHRLYTLPNMDYIDGSLFAREVEWATDTTGIDEDVLGCSEAANTIVAAGMYIFASNNGIAFTSTTDVGDVTSITYSSAFARWVAGTEGSLWWSSNLQQWSEVQAKFMYGCHYLKTFHIQDN